MSSTLLYFFNNSIAFLMVQVEQKAADESLDYLVKNTNGSEYYMFRPEGLSTIIQDIVSIPSGIYTFSFYCPDDTSRKITYYMYVYNKVTEIDWYDENTMLDKWKKRIEEYINR